MTKERPILFSAEMVKAILDGRKTMTRRVVKKIYPEREPSRRFGPGPCPYGQPGDRLWVRETWQHNPFGGIVYKAGSGIVDCDGRGWKPSIFMPRWASRITLEKTAVRVERVKDISEEDARAEGLQDWYWENPAITNRGRFHAFWDSLNAKRGYGWDVNPWVWVISFKRVE